MYKTNLKSLEVDEDRSSTPLSYNAGKAVYISGAGLYKERAADSEHIFCVETVKENVQLLLKNYVHLINIVK